eukprot:CAMPEP_0118924582 /NCGR_PEP_ID=MMETSP1169-20130426/2653_1 /TAXON_ID=36882 /ORGANISM="Pyramimonas obovata, Strain CCMP722" /LENGTH=258 /DNA_ID=CAMNT_0006865709 /DNA_START=30 /DNA_END=802 /DNA_ORIENTATION=+
MSCCPPNSLPALIAPEGYTPKGEVSTLLPYPLPRRGSELKCYEVGSGDKAVVVCYDIFGFDAGRNKGICDQLAEAGFLVVLPDFFRGDDCAKSGASPMTDGAEKFMAWFSSVGSSKTVKADVDSIIVPYLKSKGVSKIATVGFCAGAFWSLAMCCAPPSPFTCGVLAHPSLGLSKAVGEDDAEAMAKRCTCPQLFMPAGNDPQNVQPGGEVVKAVEAAGHAAQCVPFPEMTHGWMPRGDLSQPSVQRDVAAGVALIVG